MFNVDTIIELFNDNYNFAFIISILINIAIAISGIIPSVFITGANIIFFGPFNGFLISLLGETLGAYITFYVYRAGFKKTVETFVDKNKLLKEIVDSSGKRATLLIFQGRLLPFIPSGFITLAAAISSINVIHFIIATALGKVPSILLEVLVSYDFINLKDNWIRFAITIIAIIMIYITLKKKNSSN